MRSGGFTPEGIAEIVRRSVAVKQSIIENSDLIALIATVGEEMTRALTGGRRILLFGNGGSAADAQHIAAELVGRFLCERRALPALALTTNTSIMTAIANDYSFEQIFARQIEAFGAPKDMAVGISTSGKSPNVIQGIKAAKAIGLITTGMTGQEGGELAKIADYCIRVPSVETARIQEAHIMIGHIWCELVDERFV